MPRNQCQQNSELNTVNFIKSRLAPGEHIQASVLLEQARKQGISPSQLEAARIELGIYKQKIGTGTRWIWNAVQTGDDHGDSENSADIVSDNAAVEQETPSHVFITLLNHPLATADDKYKTLRFWTDRDCERVAAEVARERENNPPKKKRAKCDCHSVYVCARHRGEDE